MLLYNNNIFIDSKEQHINWGRSSDILIDSNLFISKSFIFSGPTIDDKIIDTSTINPALRKYANPTGLVSFKNNFVIILDNDTIVDIVKFLPKIRKEFMNGTTITKVETNKLLTGIKNFLLQKNIGQYIDVNKISFLKDYELLVDESLKQSLQ